MIKEVKIYNRFNMDVFVHTGGLNFPYTDRPWYLISIHTDDDPLLTDVNQNVFKEMGCRSAISLKFWDITDTDAARISQQHGAQAEKFKKDMVLFSTEQAKTVIGFLSSCNQDDENDGILIVHCDAGVSRSGAVGTFAVDFFNLSYEDFIKANPYLRPNYYVLRILRKMAGMDKYFQL